LLYIRLPRVGAQHLHLAGQPGRAVKRTAYRHLAGGGAVKAVADHTDLVIGADHQSQAHLQQIPVEFLGDRIKHHHVAGYGHPGVEGFQIGQAFDQADIAFQGIDAVFVAEDQVGIGGQLQIGCIGQGDVLADQAQVDRLRQLIGRIPQASDRHPAIAGLDRTLDQHRHVVAASGGQLAVVEFQAQRRHLKAQVLEYV
jgi:hypothetical protein